MFQKYMHLERFNTLEVRDIEFGTVFVFPKLDGANASIWFEDGIIRWGSRNMETTLLDGLPGFRQWVQDNFDKLMGLFDEYPDATLYGEWLIPHSFTGYRESAWKQFYIFDVLIQEQYLHYNYYSNICKEFRLPFIPAQKIIINPSAEMLEQEMNTNTYLIDTKDVYGEGIVIKNYSWSNSHGRQTWAKLVRQEFKEQNAKVFGPSVLVNHAVEQEIVDKFCTGAFVEKEYHKILQQNAILRQEWMPKQIPQLLETVFYEFCNEETYNFVKHFKNPIVDFKMLRRLVTMKIKSTLPQVF